MTVGAAPERRWRELPTVGDLLVRAAVTEPDPRAGIVTPDGRESWVGVLTRAERLAEGLSDLGLGTGSRIALVADNSIEGVEALFACMLMGAVAIPVNTRFAVPEMRHVLTDGQADAVVVTDHPDAPGDLPGLVRGAVPGLAHAADAADLHCSDVPSLRVAAAVASQPVPGFAGVDREPGADPAATARRVDRLRERVSLRQTALMVYTSGTTARPHGRAAAH